jgi:hypothetical protein
MKVQLNRVIKSRTQLLSRYQDTRDNWYVEAHALLKFILVYDIPIVFRTKISFANNAKHVDKPISVALSLCLYSPLDPGRFFTQSAGLLGQRISPSQGRSLHTELKHRINAHRHSCLKCDSNPRSQCSSG